MTREEAIRILDPETMGETLAEIEYYGGFRGRTKAAQALYDACMLAVPALREQEERSKPKESQPSDGIREKLIEILKTKYDHFCDQCGINKDSKYTENLASHLIANGVTVQE